MATELATIDRALIATNVPSPQKQSELDHHKEAQEAQDDLLSNFRLFAYS
jgi:hypothetical protein